MNQLEQLASLTTIVADTGDIASIAKIQPQDATTNPSLILKASKDPAYRAFLTEAVENSVSLEDAADRVLVNFGAEILKHVKGRVSTEVDARLSFDVEKTIAKARRLIELYEEKGIESLLLRERIYVEYLNNTHVYALKNSGKKKFYTQHSTWIKTQYYSLFTNIGNLPGAILSGKFDYADRILQWFIFPRTILLGILLLFSFLSVYFHWSACLKWWGLLLTFLLTMAIATPNYLVDSKFNKAMKAIPFLAAGMIFNMLLRKKK